MESPLITVAEAADYLRVSLGTMRSLISRRDVAAIRIGTGQGRIRLTRDALDTYLASKTEPPQSGASAPFTLRRSRIVDCFPHIPKG